MKKNYNFDEKDTVLRLRLPSSMKNDLQILAERKGLNLSQFMRNFIEGVLNDEENQDILSSSTNYYYDEKQDENDDMQATISIRCQQTLKEMYNACCMQNSLKGSELLRKHMRDIVEFRYRLHSNPLRPLLEYIDYILIFLRIAEYNKAHAYMGYRRLINQDIPLEAPVIEQLDELHYRINDTFAKCAYIVTFCDLFDMDVQVTPFK